MNVKAYILSDGMVARIGVAGQVSISGEGVAVAFPFASLLECQQGEQALLLCVERADLGAFFEDAGGVAECGVSGHLG